MTQPIVSSSALIQPVPAKPTSLVQVIPPIAQLYSKPTVPSKPNISSPDKPYGPQSAKFIELSPYYKHGLEISKKSFKPKPINSEAVSTLLSPRQNEIVNL